MREALNRAAIPTVGPPMDVRFATEPVEQAHEGRRMTAVLNARYRRSGRGPSEGPLPEGDYEVRAAEPWPPELTP